jgi:3-phenylpropionate/cinnamic acid dioxygenase small subunit
MDSDGIDAIERLIAKDEITDLVRRYSYCVDHRPYDEVVELFTADCVVDYGPGVPPVRSRAGLRRMFGLPDSGFAATSHHNANVLVTFEDLDHASVRTSVYAWHRRTDGSTPCLWGYYHDSMVRRPEGWRIAERQLRTLGAEDWNMEMHPALTGEAHIRAWPGSG